MPTWNAIYLGKFTQQLDSIENSVNPQMSEGIGSFLGKNYGSASDPLFRHVVGITTIDRVGAKNALDTYNTAKSYDQISFNLGSGKVTTVFDGQTKCGMQVTYTDGTKASIEARIFQDTEGNLFLAPSETMDAAGKALAAKAIQSVFTTFNAGHIGNLSVNRVCDNFIACFTPGTLIDTHDGPRLVEDLKAGDAVLTRDNGVQILRWTGGRPMELHAGNDHLRPILIAAGALGEGLPVADLRVSPQHRVLVRSAIARRMFGAEEVLVAAKHLVGLPGIEVDRVADSVTYLHILFDRHEIVFSNGAPTESLFTGPEAMKSVPEAARDEIMSLFPELAATNALPVPARMLLNGRRGRQLAERHLNKGRPVYVAAINQPGGSSRA
ncbi:Hint domain-containing protein [Paracoccus caeni]|uniref:Hint domain-containing protein n=1 Tax=Paracoccus caeni TaxID=657651 RepID=A0A934W063_9RHOB|nr:Hint domain-containing protein [Paracoccus caeni]MBK4215504.1 Hint domain-containing protein [Paracoccus caeni]